MKSLAPTLLLSLITIMGTSCQQAPHQIVATCEIDQVYNYLIKWEVTSGTLDKNVSIYYSNTPNNFNREEPIMTLPIKTGFAKIILGNAIAKPYFLLVFDNNAEKIVSPRIQKFNGVQNFRDLGGYPAAEGKTVKWGMIYRSGKLTNIKKSSIDQFKSLGIKTIIDFRSTKEYQAPPKDLGFINIINLPIASSSKEEMIQKINEQKIKRGDASVALESIYIDLTENGQNALRNMFSLLSDVDNYPILISCDFGKDLSGFAANMILASLGVPNEYIVKDYGLSSIQLSDSMKTEIINNYDTDTQEAITVLIESNFDFINYIHSYIDKKYGGQDEYLLKRVKLNPLKKAVIQKILLEKTK